MERLLKATNTTTLSTTEPLIPIDNEEWRQKTLTHSVETTVFKYFEFQSNTITIIPATATESLCPGKLCDAQSRLKIWGCATAGSKRIWALTINFTCEEFAPFEGLKYGPMTSHATTVRNFQIMIHS